VNQTPTKGRGTFAYLGRRNVLRPLIRAHVEPASVWLLGLAIGLEFGEDSDYAAKLGELCRSLRDQVSRAGDRVIENTST